MSSSLPTQQLQGLALQLSPHPRDPTMAKLSIITAPDPRLKLKAKPVGRVDDETRRLMDDMLETMYEAPGIGLAAPQVGVLKRVIVLDLGGEERQPLRIADPEILWVSDEDTSYEEGC